MINKGFACAGMRAGGWVDDRHSCFRGAGPQVAEQLRLVDPRVLFRIFGQFQCAKEPAAPACEMSA